ncbi:MAG: hypoxanthine phosphoribosyltransferase [Myxococcota bacterium]
MVLRPLIEAPVLAARVQALGAEIRGSVGDDVTLVVVGVLRGSFVFMADLVRAIEGPVTCEFLQVESYAGNESTGEIRPIREITGDLAGEHVIIVEDIVDTGRTVAYLRERIEAQAPASFRVVALLDKPSRRTVDVVVDWVGFTIEDCFVVGYGLDFDGLYRNLPYIAEAVVDGEAIMEREELEVLTEQLDELLNAPIVDEDDALEICIVAGLAYRLGASPAVLADAAGWRDGTGAELVASLWQQVDLEPLIEEVDACTLGGRDDDEVEEAVYDVDDVVAAAIWCNRRDAVREAARRLARIVREVPDVFTNLATFARSFAAKPAAAADLDIYDYWLALADTGELEQ